jgi:hypothetical protein
MKKNRYQNISRYCPFKQALTTERGGVKHSISVNGTLDMDKSGKKFLTDRFENKLEKRRAR